MALDFGIFSPTLIYRKTWPKVELGLTLGQDYDVSLKVYNRKRKFDETPEPKGKKKTSKGPLRFVVQLHRASRLHYDFRLEFDGVFKSWAVPKGPSLNPLDQRLAVFVEDHPLDYGSFEGIIPKGNYGAGTVMLWDEGRYLERGSKDRKTSEAAMLKNFAKGHITFVLDGQKLNGEFALIRLNKDKTGKAWLLVKKRDEHATYKRNKVFDDYSVKSGRGMEEIAKASEGEGNVWLPKKGLQKESPRAPKRSTSRLAPMPRKNKPMLATENRNPVGHPDWILDPHRDGLRTLAEVENTRVHLYSKSGLSFNKKLPNILEALKNLKLQAVLDGEIVGQGPKAIYYVFDLLFADGKDLRKEKLVHRKGKLKELLKDSKHVKLADSPNNPLKDPSYIAKNPESLYKPGTTSDWVYVKHTSAKAKSKGKVASTEEARITHPEKIYFPDDGITKGQVIEYYQNIAPYILPYLKDRPESLNRHPNGIKAKGFYQKDMTGYIPKWFKTERIFSESSEKSINYPVVQDERSLIYIANLGCIEIHPWFSRIQKLDHPDFLVIDLDPDGNSFDHVMEIAHEFHEILDAIGATNVCKTSGATGIHIGVPTAAKYDFDTVRSFAEEVCKIVLRKHPATTSMDRSPNRRRRKIYLDYMQNRRGQTLAAPFCLRPHPGAPVSMPLNWRELEPGLKPEDFTIENSLARIKKSPDPWKAVLGPGISLEKCLKNLQRKFNRT